MQPKAANVKTKGAKKKQTCNQKVLKSQQPKMKRHEGSTRNCIQRGKEKDKIINIINRDKKVYITLTKPQKARRKC
jgi:hypothetical protein